jgi:DNA-binding LacI/PurR family transcriptional regulator
LLAKTILDRISDPSQPVKTSQIETQLILRDTTAAPT